MRYQWITLRQQDRVATVVLDRPEQRNALDDTLIRELTEALNLLNRDNGVRAVVLTGEGKAFCAGMDLGYLRKVSELGEHENLEDARNLVALLRTVVTLRKPVIAMVNGPAMGGGCGLAAACDFLFVSAEHARLGVPEVKIGFVPAVILPFLIRRMGEAAAREFALTGGVCDASTAVARGLATEAVPHARLAERVNGFAAELAASTSASSLALTKELLGRLPELSFSEALEYAANLNALARKTDDFRKGLEAFERRDTPRW